MFLLELEKVGSELRHVREEDDDGVRKLEVGVLMLSV